MERQPTSTAHIGGYRIIRTLGSGTSAIVKLGRSPQGEEVALKIFRQGHSMREQLFQELSMMKLLKHPNLVNLIDVMDRAEYVDEEGHRSRSLAMCIALELVEEGDMWDYIHIPGALSEVTARTYFCWLMHGLKHIHSKGVCHRDIKLDNLLLNREFFLKIADFGFATKLEGEDKSGILRQKLGTAGYMAPEIYLLKYVGTQVDVFAAGVVLFMFCAGYPPFQKATATDHFCRLIRDRKFVKFWALHEEGKPPGIFSEEFKSLIEGMLAFEPNERLTVEQILTHPWLGKNGLNHEELLSEFTSRKSKIREHKEQKRRKAEQRRRLLDGAIMNKETLDRALAGETTTLFLTYYEKEEATERKLETTTVVSSRDLVVEQNHAIFFAMLFTFLSQKLEMGKQYPEMTPTFEVNSSKVDVVYTFDYGGTESELGMTLTINSTPKKNICLKSLHTKGNEFYYNLVMDRLREQFSYCRTEEL